MKRLFTILLFLNLLLPIQATDTNTCSLLSASQPPIEIEHSINYDIQKADSLVKAGKPDEALPFYKKSLQTKDSLYNLLTALQMEEILSLYNADRLVLQREQKRSMFHQICLSVSLIIIIALLFFNIRIYRSRKRLQKDEQEMKRLTAIAEKANEVKSRFLANMSYNIRIPLNNVVGFSQLMTEDASLNEEEKKEYSGIIQANSAELIQLVNNVLDLSRLEADMMKFQLQECNIQEWCNDLAYIVRTRSDGNIHLQLQADTGGATIRTDINRFTQIVCSMLLYPVECKETREVEMLLTYNTETKEINCRIENSPLADPAFSSQKEAILQKINLLFFEHFKGSYQVKKGEKDGVAILFTYPVLTP